MVKTVIGIFDNAVDAEQAMRRLALAGFSNDQIHINDTATASSGAATDEESEKEGGLSRFFKNLFSNDEEDSDKYVRVARYSESVVTVRAASAEEAEQAVGVLDSCGAINVDKHAAQDTRNGYEREAVLPAAAQEPVVEAQVLEHAKPPVQRDEKVSRIPVLEEHLRQTGVEVLTGGTRLRSRIIEHPDDRTPGGRDESMPTYSSTKETSDTGFANFTTHNIALTETREVPVFSKEARVVEEIRVGKEVEVTTETFRDTVRKTEIDVQDLTGSVNRREAGGV